MEFQLSSFELFLQSSKRYTDKSVYEFMSDLKCFTTFLENRNVVSITQIKIEDIKEFLKYLKFIRNNAARTVARKITTLRLYFNYLSANFNIENFGLKLIMPKLKDTLPVFLTEAEIEALLMEAAKDLSPIGLRNKLILCLLYTTAVRVTELISIKISDIKFDERLILISGKGGKERLVPVPQEVILEIDRYLTHVHPKLKWKEDIQFLFPGFATCQPLTRQHIFHIISQLAKKAGISKKISPHKLRHSLATHLINKGMGIRMIQVLLGHQSITNTALYTHLDKSFVGLQYNKKHPRA